MFPEILDDYGPSRSADIRCGMTKQFLEGKLDNPKASQIWFKEGNNFEAIFQFGCGVYIGP